MRRPEIQLLRAVAVLAVVANHLAPGLVPGGYLGVDVFFVISGFLITSHLLRELDATGRVRLGAFWARRVRRLLPASMLVLLCSGVATVLLLPVTLWRQVMTEVAGCALYVQNLVLAHEAQDYFASAESPSPVTHYWSLSVEEQFYLLWPLLALGAFALGRRRFGARRLLALVFAAGALGSLGFATWALAAAPNAAYFLTPARVWEFAAGGLLALAPAGLPRLRHAVAGAAWLVLLGSVLWFDAGAGVPGPVTLVPVLATLAVIAAGDAFCVREAPGVTQARVAGLWVGEVSYSLYLWHWPLIVVAPHVLAAPLTPASKPALLGVSLVLAGLTTRLVEDPARHARWLVEARPRRSLVLAGVAMALVVGATVVVDGVVERRTERVRDELAVAAAADPCFGARSMVNDCADPHRLRYGDAVLLTAAGDQQDDEGAQESCQQTPTGTTVRRCGFGDPRGEAPVRAALVGDSHASHWKGALEPLAREHGWHVEMMTKSSCPANAAAGIEAAWDDSIAPSCHRWTDAVVDEIAEDPAIDVVFVSAISRRYVVPDAPRGRQLTSQATGYQRVWRRWTDAGKTVVVIGDVPRMDRGDLPTCVAESEVVDDPCAAPARTALGTDPLLVAARELDDPAVVPVDLSRFFCDRRRCHTVIGGVVAYGDASHLVGAFSSTLAPYLYDAVTPLPND